MEPTSCSQWELDLSLGRTQPVLCPQRAVFLLFLSSVSRNPSDHFYRFVGPCPAFHFNLLLVFPAGFGWGGQSPALLFLKPEL